MEAMGHKRMSRRSVTVKDVPADAFIKACADFLKRQPKFDVPKYHDIVKTGTFKELAPYEEDWCGCVEKVVWRIQRYPCGHLQGPLLQGVWFNHSQGDVGTREARDDGALQ